MIKINNKLFKRSIEKRHNGGVSRIGRSSFFAKSKSYRLGYKENDPYGLRLIELDFTEKKGRRPYKGPPRGKKQHGGKKILIYYSCGKPGHFARDCKSKNIVYQQQLNILEKVQT